MSFTTLNYPKDLLRKLSECNCIVKITPLTWSPLKFKYYSNQLLKLLITFRSLVRGIWTTFYRISFSSAASLLCGWSWYTFLFRYPIRKSCAFLSLVNGKTMRYFHLRRSHDLEIEHVQHSYLMPHVLPCKGLQVLVEKCHLVYFVPTKL